MTRSEFINGIQEWRDLLDFCWRYDCGICEDIVSDDDLSQNIDEDIENGIRNYHWTDIRNWLNEIDNSALYYRRNGSFEYESVDDDFDDYKENVLEWCDGYGAFDDEEDEDFEELEDDEEENAEPDICSDHDFSVTELINACNSQYKSASDERIRIEQEEEARVAAFLCSC